MKLIVLILLLTVIIGCDTNKVVKPSEETTQLVELNSKVDQLNEKVEALINNTQQATKRETELYQGIATLCDALKGVMALHKLEN
jgi:outer membrane murein-binding lipoprotein Lpp